MGNKYIERFGNTWTKRWNVINIDKTANTKCKYNFTIDFDKQIDREILLQLSTQIKNTAEEIDAIINVASSIKPKEQISISSELIFDRYEQIRNSEIQSHILLTHLATKHLSPNGYVVFDGGCPEIYQGENVNQFDFLERLARSVTVK